MLVHKIYACASNVVHKFHQGRLCSSVGGLVSKETVMQRQEQRDPTEPTESYNC